MIKKNIFIQVLMILLRRVIIFYIRKIIEIFELYLEKNFEQNEGKNQHFLI